ADILRAERVPAELIMRRIEGHVERFIGRPFAELAVERRIREVKCPLLVVHGTADEVVPYAHFERIRRAAGGNVETLSVPGVDHDAVKTAPLAEERVKAFLVSHLLKA
ncbi:MAG TPA: alpha/beta hydrolase, partial [Symbiobacteriaceae bacterium]|nr:alpha/beta hydrolase [Symbiobacteriaceae bacterium]